MEENFIASRMDHLNNFIKLFAQYKFFVESFEFKIFVGYSHDALEEQYKALLDEDPIKIFEKYQ